MESNKKFRLIKEYPGSMDIGYIVDKESSFDVDINLICTYEELLLGRHKEYWEEVIESDYKILSFKSSEVIIRLISNGRYLVSTMSENDLPIKNTTNDGYGATWENALEDIKSGKYTISSVKRLSDGEVFTVGDTVQAVSGTVKFKLNAFKLNSNKIECHYSLNTEEGGFDYLKDIIKSENPFFTTEDGVGIHEGETYFIVTTDSHIMQELTCYGNNVHNVKKFSTEKAARNYIKCNKPLLSYNEVLSIYHEWFSKINQKTFKDILTREVKNKLK